jgi:hypothetical protein
MIYHTKHGHVFMIYLHTELHMPSTSGSLVIVMKHKSKNSFRMSAILVTFYIMLPLKHFIFFEDVFVRIISEPRIISA